MTSEVLMTRKDVRRLQQMIQDLRASGRQHTQFDALERELARARALSIREVPEDVVTMNSRVRLRDLATDERDVYTVVYPRRADWAVGRIPVLAPLATALLGVREGAVIRHGGPDSARTLEVERVLYQPEAAGDYHL
ncbi:MAG: GreA/GreB family elongation factor [Bacillota bacterium]